MFPPYQRFKPGDIPCVSRHLWLEPRPDLTVFQSLLYLIRDLVARQAAVFHRFGKGADRAAPLTTGFFQCDLGRF